MKVLGIATSPRRGANSQTLVENILAGAKEAGAKTEIVRLCMMNIQPCLGCNKCKTEDRCVIEDDMEVLLEKLEGADAVVLGSPVYWGRLNAQAYPFIDRLIVKIKPDFTTDFPKGKKLAVALTCGGMAPEAMKPINDYVKFVFGFFGFVDGGFICQNNCLLPDDITHFKDTLQKAKELGRALVK